MDPPFLRHALLLLILYALFAVLIDLFLNYDIIRFTWLVLGPALFLVMRHGMRMVVVCMLGVVVGNLLQGQINPEEIFWLTIRHGMVVAIGALIYRRSGGMSLTFEYVSDYMRLYGVALLLGCLSALIGKLQQDFGWIRPDPYGMLHWVGGTSFGFISGMLFLLIWQQRSHYDTSPKTWREGIVIIGLSVIVGQVVFLSWWHDSLGQLARGYWMFLFVTLAALRLGPKGTGIVVMITTIQGIVGAYLHLGFFANDIEKTGLTNYFFYMLSLSSDGTLVAMLFMKGLHDRHDLALALERASEASKSKSIFLANMSHEIRTPMNAILGMAELLEESELNADQRKFVNVFRSAGENLLGVINDVLDISKIESGQMTLESTGFDLAEEMDITCEIMALRAHSKGLELVRHLHANTPERLQGDPVRLRQIFLNLLSNAIKFTESGVIRFEARQVTPPVEAEETDRVWVTFTVADSGIGIAPDRIDTIFESFVQADSSITRRFGGTGLGLAIVKKLVDQMGGTIQVESQPDAGTSFRFTLSFAPGVDVTTPVLPDLRNVRILAVDDTPINLMVLREFLRPTGADLEEAMDGATALVMMERSVAQGRPYQLLLLDLRMPGMDGLSLLECWRAAHHSGLPILMLTSDHRESYLQRCQELDVSYHLTKPVRRMELMQLIEQALQLQTGDASSNGARDSSKAFQLSPWRILLVDDSSENRILVEMYFKETPCELQTANHGAIALEMLEKDSFDLVLMDVQMPVMDGYSATRAWRRREQERGTTRLPILALSANALTHDLTRSLEAGCDDHLSKPIKKRTLFEAIRRHARPL
ncbi:MAG: response regulator [Magnetococcus sp. YQC-9]